MKDVLYGLFYDLKQRCQVLRMLLEQHQCHSDVVAYRAEVLEWIAQVEDEIEGLMKDPSLREDSLLANNLQNYRLRAQTVKIFEWYPVPIILRYGPSDHYFFAFMEQSIDEIKYPFPTPIVSTSSSEYYVSYPDFNLIRGPVLEEYSLLGLPDLFHELGHILVNRQRNEILSRFDRDLKNHFNSERQRIRAAQRPPEYEEIIESIQQQWIDEWTVEFTCDMIACYLVGPSYGWANLRLCASSLSDNVFWPGPDDVASTHPSDDARVKGIVEILNLIGSEVDAAQIKQRWDDYVSLTGHNPPSDYALCYPTPLLKKLARYVLRGCKELGLKAFSEQESRSGSTSISNLLNNAWKEFFARPHEYPIWEQHQLAELRLTLDCSPL